MDIPLFFFWLFYFLGIGGWGLHLYFVILALKSSNHKTLMDYNKEAWLEFVIILMIIIFSFIFLIMIGGI